GLAACQAERATFCDGYVADALVLAKDFEARKCTEQHSGYLSTDPDAQRKFCLEQSRGNLDSTAQSRKILLDTCIAKQAAAGGGGGAGGAGGVGGGGGAGNAGGGAGDAGGGVGGQPSPEQCATVPIEPDGAPAPVGVGPATAANGLQINKVVAPGAPCTSTNCAFTITVKNTNAAPMPGPIKVIDLAQPELPGGQIGPITTGKIVTGPTAPWTCAKRPPQNIDFEC